MQDNQFHIDLLKSIFPKSIVRESSLEGEPSIKCNVKKINRKELESLYFGVPDSIDINLKRSGTGITVILTNKKV